MTFIRFLLWATFLSICGTFLILASAFLYLSPGLPDVEALREVKLQTPLRVYSADQKLIAEFGEKRRTPIKYSELPELMIKAFVAAEDNRFYSHHGVDPKGLARAAVQLLQSGSIRTGGSTITMQVARNFFLSRERVFSRKFNEILLALQIERELPKEEILELYLNKIYLGNRAYGVAAAAQVYYGKSLDELNLAEIAMIAGLPKAPSKYNPIVNPDRALERRNWILHRMNELGFIDEQQYNQAKEASAVAKYHGLTIELNSPYLAEMVRKAMVDRYGPNAYTDGYSVYTTINSSNQEMATQSLQDGLVEYEWRHGYRGPEKQMPPEAGFDQEKWQQALKKVSTIGRLVPAIVTSLDKKTATILTKKGEQTLSWDGLKWARLHKTVNSLGPAPKKAADILAVGDLIRTIQVGETLYLAQIPKVQGALVSLRPSDAAVTAIVGGFDFNRSKFNRATQASRQPGSNFKPFLYSAALENGYTAASTVNDAPIIYNDTSTNKAWRPKNSSGKFLGPTRLRKALYQSRNLVSIRLLQALGINKMLSYVDKFGFDPEALPRDLSLSLGSGAMTPIDLAKGYASLANGGYRVEPYFIDHIEHLGNTVYQAQPYLAGSVEEGEAFKPAPRIMDERANYILYTMLQDVIKRGTGRRALVLKRSDIAGKTGTTNDQVDAWFSGFNSDLTTTVWVGYDQPSTLGRREFGGTAALPIWIKYMGLALAGKPEHPLKQPDGLVKVKINANTGKPTQASAHDTIFEIFRTELAPKYDPSSELPGLDDEGALKTEDIF
ncbi:penicillin-binding protein 1A [Spartinivicinus poritis]|uniref:Penicillin-binding protein 1A n=1 Tax=Spartinivicinus poritis TaxID=2994640 RepID=A0ABT5U5X2_9GAMM|nr:penicillin-binding protein 1A [Spartinivicinus sp. A2-2]MDE1461766.1 penicillin-binding protein 1A [Spartinivicinus sp. A2-2]